MKTPFDVSLFKIRTATAVFNRDPGLENLQQVTERKDKAVSSGAFARTADRPQRAKTAQDNWLGFVGDVLKFSGEVQFRSMLRIDGHFSGHVDSEDGTLIVSNGAHVQQAVINVAVAKINGIVEGDINASQEVVLGPTADVTGKVSTLSLIVEEGAIINGRFERRDPAAKTTPLHEQRSRKAER